jgi:hypothetical protein
MQRPDALESVAPAPYVQQILDHASAAIFVKRCS